MGNGEAMILVVVKQEEEKSFTSSQTAHLLCEDVKQILGRAREGCCENNDIK